MTSIPKLKPMGKGNSFFTFIDNHCEEKKSDAPVNRALHRLCSLMRKMEVKTVIIEEVATIYQEIKDELIALKTYYGEEIPIKAYRFTFLSEEISTLKEITRLKDDCFLSSAILINFKDAYEGIWRSYLYKAVVTIPKIINYKKYGNIPLLNNYLHIYKTFSCKVSINDNKFHEFNITGSFFCQQNSKTSVCAHASLCMTINNMNLPNVGLISAENINKIIGIDHINLKFGDIQDGHKEGLDVNEIQKVLEEFGLSISINNFFLEPNEEYNEYVYSYIESKCPVLLVFTTDESLHVVSVLGHTLNSDMWRPEAESAYLKESRIGYIPASKWIDHFIIHDDNFGMYLCLPVESLKRVTLPLLDSKFRAYSAIAIVPSVVTTPSWEAEEASIIVTATRLKQGRERGKKLDDWSKRLLISSESRLIDPKLPRSVDPRLPQPTVRTFLLKREDYLKSLNEKDFMGNIFSKSDKLELTKNLPDCFWLSEITLSDLYTANKSKVVDFFYRCDNPKRKNYDEIFKRWIQIRFPYVLLKPPTSTGSFNVIPMAVKSHYPLFRFESEQSILDW